MKIGIFGGSFNPIHNAHIALAETLLTTAGIDEIWLVVSPQNPFKQQAGLLPDELRLLLTRKALEDKPRLKVCDYEIYQPRPSYMWNTLQGLSNEHPYHQFTLIIGSDNWERFGEWYHAEDILKNYPIVVYPRPGYDIDVTTLPQNVTLVNSPMMNISSTEIRQRITEGKTIDDLVPKIVSEILMRNNESETPV